MLCRKFSRLKLKTALHFCRPRAGPFSASAISSLDFGGRRGKCAREEKAIQAARILPAISLGNRPLLQGSTTDIP
jgi:hypothetical protein